MLWMILPLTVSLILTVVLSVVYRDREKTDKGFRFTYFGLSYRRKFIRTLWITPVLALIVWFISYNNVWPQTISILLVALLIITQLAQLGYNYYKMKQTEE
ncbi:hypothetical protein [Marinilactibacillus sp. Marseille-P9653]|uniref:hypothetical protein n=1 Tax=Marinilactibacillus sp. Marseille-P9653 TaxID=2866583 RepID=UPI001CE3C0A2|nr:hypothetical protein [Marinilactibacillus sp. Marseille-P9653]